MALGNLTKQLAEQAIAETLRGKPEAQTQTDDLSTTIVGEIQAMQRALKDEDELLVIFQAGSETVRVVEIFLPSRGVAVLSGQDAEKNVTRVVSPVAALQLICKVVKVQPPAKPVRVNFVVPKAKS